ncbi:MAG: STAS domain-containing protein [Gemmataceae bacterium]|nr:STAS domain-containing protein [Gemmataceae bacterium]
MSARRRDGSGEVIVVGFPCVVLDTETMQAAQQTLFDLVQRRPAKLLLNLRKVQSISSGALGRLITLNRALTAAGGRLVLCYLDPQIYEFFEQTKLDRLFRIEDDPAADQEGSEIRLHTPTAAKRAAVAEPVILRFPGTSPE